MCAACACACALQSTVDAAGTVVDEAEEQAVDEQLQQLRQQIAAAKHHGKKCECSFAAQVGASAHLRRNACSSCQLGRLARHIVMLSLSFHPAVLCADHCMQAVS
jgi:hypothetical protein